MDEVFCPYVKGGGVAIFYIIKNMLLQLLIAGSFAGLFPLGLDIYQRKKKKKSCFSKKEISIIIILSGSLSIILCFTYSTVLYEVFPINLAILSAFVGILYGGVVAGLPLAAIYLLCYIIFTPDWTWFTFLTNTGILVFPFLFLSARTFYKGTLLQKRTQLWLCFFPALAIMEVSIHFQEFRLVHLTLSEHIVIIVYLLISMIVGSLMIRFIEYSLERLLLKKQVMGISEKYLREEDRLSQIIDAAPISMLSVNHHGAITSINDMMLELFRLRFPHVTKQEVIGKPGVTFMEAEVESIGRRLDEALKGLKTYNELIELGSRMAYISTSPITNSYTGETIGAVLVIQDISELHSLRNELGNLERLSLVGQMAASITHEIRNPMAVVRGFLQLMKEKSPASLDHYYRIVMEELDRANGIINDFLSLAQNRNTEMEECHLHDIIQDLIPLLWADANLRGQSIEVNLDEQVPRLRLNAKEIKQLILNLSRNGMEAMQEKGQLTLETRHEDGAVKFIVRDTGAGISKAQQERLFEPFYTTKAKGTGLGLALCLSVVERHHAKITVDSEEGVGTSFTVKFTI